MESATVRLVRLTRDYEIVPYPPSPNFFMVHDKTWDGTWGPFSNRGEAEACIARNKALDAEENRS